MITSYKGTIDILQFDIHPCIGPWKYHAKESKWVSEQFINNSYYCICAAKFSFVFHLTKLIQIVSRKEGSAEIVMLLIVHRVRNT